ncbi:Uncharacterised protein [Mycobacterium tuberculosis]|nr:Uncharacterised protein [Mycobacterium tuberculosis]
MICSASFGSRFWVKSTTPPASVRHSRTSRRETRTANTDDSTIATSPRPPARASRVNAPIAMSWPRSASWSRIRFSRSYSRPLAVSAVDRHTVGSMTVTPRSARAFCVVAPCARPCAGMTGVVVAGVPPARVRRAAACGGSAPAMTWSSSFIIRMKSGEAISRS